MHWTTIIRPYKARWIHNQQSITTLDQITWNDKDQRENYVLGYHFTVIIKYYKSLSDTHADDKDTLIIVIKLN